MTGRWIIRAAFAALVVCCPAPAARAAWSPAAAGAAGREFPAAPPADTLRFTPIDSEFPPGPEAAAAIATEDRILRARFRDYVGYVLTDIEEWNEEHRMGDVQSDPTLDYNRVDGLRVGLRTQFQSPFESGPRLGVRIDYSFARRHGQYGVQIEQPLLPGGWLAAGFSMERHTDHSELQQVEDIENTLALLFARQDYRDYFEREGLGVYAAVRMPTISTLSVHFRNDEVRSLAVDRRTRSWFHRDRELRDNPAVDDGESHAMSLRLERLARRTRAMRAGLYHWVEIERAGRGLGGDFHHTRLLADLRGVLRLSPAQTLSLRAVGGHTLSGELPRHRQFTAGGVDGLRAHPFASFRGDEMMLAQAEYTVGLWRVASEWFEGGLHAIAFVDAGTAWHGSGRSWDVSRQQFAADGGFGVSSSEDNVRVYFARDLQDPGSDFVISMRLQRPF
jgi:hypothetical protein